MKIIFLEIGKGVLRLMYALVCLFPVKQNKVLFLSRQTNGPSLDFQLIQSELALEEPEVKMISLCQRGDGGWKNKLRLANAMIKSLYHIATAKVCVLDTYWPPVSICPRRKGTCVIQIWHALGKLKQSGYQALDRQGGRDGKISRALCMHRHYDVIIAGGKAWNPFYCQAFDVTEDKLRNIGLPRIDYLLQNKDTMRQEVQKCYPEFTSKPVVLYVPTFRRNEARGWDKLVECFDFEHYYLVVKPHPNQPLEFDQEKVYSCDEFTTTQMLCASDIIITDYSSISLEAAILEKKTYFYLYDYKDYMENNGLNIDICKEMPDCSFLDAASMIKAIEQRPYPMEELESFQRRFLPENLGNSTKEIVKLIREKQEV